MAQPVVGSSVSASQLKDLFRQIDDGSITGGHVQAFLEHRNPFKKISRFTCTVVGLGLTGAEWISRLEAGGHKLSNYARSLLANSNYDQNHRLEAGKVYKVTLVFGKEIRKDSERTTAALKDRATCEIGEQSVIGLQCELTLLIREKLLNTELEAMGIYYIVALHEPILNSDGDANVLILGRQGDRSSVDTHCDESGGHWGDRGAFAFLESTSS